MDVGTIWRLVVSCCGGIAGLAAFIWLIIQIYDRCVVRVKVKTHLATVYRMPNRHDDLWRAITELGADPTKVTVTRPDYVIASAMPSTPLPKGARDEEKTLVARVYNYSPTRSVTVLKVWFEDSAGSPRPMDGGAEGQVIVPSEQYREWWIRLAGISDTITTEMRYSRVRVSTTQHRSPLHSAMANPTEIGPRGNLAV